MNLQRCRSAKLCSRCTLEIPEGTDYMATSYKALHVECFRLEQQEKAQKEIELKNTEQSLATEVAKPEVLMTTPEPTEVKTDVLEPISISLKGKTTEEIHSYIVTQQCYKCGDTAVGLLYGKLVCGLHINDCVLDSI